jgi:general secretion pathway protein L
MLKQFLAWWLQQLTDLLPAAWRQADGPRDALVLVALPDADQGIPEVELQRPRTGEVLGRFRLDSAGQASLAATLRRQPGRKPLLLRLPASLMLERELALPLLAERAPDRVLEYEMDRFTPFRSNEVIWGWAILRRDATRNRLMLRLNYVPIASIQTLMATLAKAEIAVTALEAPGAGGARAGAMRRIALHRPASSTERGWRRGLVLLGGLCGALALAAIILPFLMQESESSVLAERQAALAPQVAEAERLRHAIAARGAGIDVVGAEQARVGDPLQVLASVTDLLPDDSFLTELSLRQGKLSLAGQSAASARLITAMSADPVIRNPAFAAPVTRVDAPGEGGHVDVFAIHAEIAP